VLGANRGGGGYEHTTKQKKGNTLKGECAMGQKGIGCWLEGGAPPIQLRLERGLSSGQGFLWEFPGETQENVQP